MELILGKENNKPIMKKQKEPVQLIWLKFTSNSLQRVTMHTGSLADYKSICHPYMSIVYEQRLSKPI